MLPFKRFSELSKKIKLVYPEWDSKIVERNTNQSTNIEDENDLKYSKLKLMVIRSWYNNDICGK